MLIKGNDADISRVVAYIGDGKYQCFYLYADMLECGTQEDGLGLWISEEDGAIKGVAYRYYATLHLFSHDVFPKSEALELIRQIRPQCVTGSQSTIEPLVGGTEDQYKLELMHLIMVDQQKDIRIRGTVELADESDVPAIAAMMMEDPIYQPVYTYERLCDELTDRLKSKFGRIFVLKNKAGEILASAAVYAETDDIAFCGGLITSKRARGAGFGYVLAVYVNNVVISENKCSLAYISTENKDWVEMNKRVGTKFLGISARLLREA